MLRRLDPKCSLYSEKLLWNLYQSAVAISQWHFCSYFALFTSKNIFCVAIPKNSWIWKSNRNSLWFWHYQCFCSWNITVDEQNSTHCSTTVRSCSASGIILVKTLVNGILKWSWKFTSRSKKPSCPSFTELLTVVNLMIPYLTWESRLLESCGKVSILEQIS